MHVIWGGKPVGSGPGRRPWEARLRTGAARSPRLLIAGLGVFMVLTGLSCSATHAGIPPWKKVWSDTFNGPADSSINTRYWEHNTGRGIFGTGEIETMTTSRHNVHLDGHGNLDLIVLGHGSGSSRDYTWTSGRVETRSSRFAAPAGGEMMVTASIRQPDAAHELGYWPGFWMLGRQAWPMDGEIDILEDVNGLSQHSGTLHCGNLTQRNHDGSFGPCHETDGLGSGSRTCAGCQRGFHTYSVIVDRRHATNQQIRWYFDGHEFFSVSERRVGQAVWTAAVDHGFSILLNVSIGGSFPNAQCRCTTPTSQTSSQGTMVVRYVDVYTN